MFFSVAKRIKTKSEQHAFLISQMEVFGKSGFQQRIEAPGTPDLLVSIGETYLALDFKPLKTTQHVQKH